ncbi:MAG: N-acetylmuramoyl-L-alanine amidase family protein [Acidimicrobiales bacterium]
MVALLALALAACAPTNGSGDATIGTGPRRTTTVPRALIDKGAIVSPAGVVMPIVERQGDAYAVSTPCGRAATVTSGRPVASAVVVLDPGHGGSDPGAVSPGGLRESPVNLAVSRYAQQALESAGVTALLTRTGDYDLELLSRAQIAKAVDAAAFVSIHHNAEPDGPWPRPGSETYYQIGSAASKRLAGLIYEEIVRALTPYAVTWVADLDAGAKYRQGTRGDYYAVLRQPAPVVSVLAELAFISNPPEAALIVRPDVQQAEGEAVARGILRYLRTQDPGSGFTEPYPRPTPPPGPGGGPAVGCVDPPL